VSLADNAKEGQKLSAYAPKADDTPLSSRTGPQMDLRSPIMAEWFTPHIGTMDYQSVYGEIWEYNRSYIDVTSYNYGIVAAAAGYGREEALYNAGWLNRRLHSDPNLTSGPFGNKVQNADMIAKGYDDYKAGRIIPLGE
jgi:hypothetical protein